jgi:TfoX/Sxy family transcriptional regulator of competence genes
MARTTDEEIERILDTLVPLNVRALAMFGGHALYCDEKVVGLIMEGELYVKPSGVEPEVLEGTTLAPPYPGARQYHLVPDDLLADSGWMIDAIQSTANALPPPKPKRRRASST